MRTVLSFYRQKALFISFHLNGQGPKNFICKLNTSTIFPELMFDPGRQAVIIDEG